MSPSIYEDLRAYESNANQDIEERAGMAVDEDNLRAGFDEYELDNTDIFDGQESTATAESNALLSRPEQQRERRGLFDRRKVKDNNKAKILTRSPRLLEDEGDDDVPASLLIEEEAEAGLSRAQKERSPNLRSNTKPVGGVESSTKTTQTRWAATQARHGLHQDDQASSSLPHVLQAGSPQEKAMWTWINVANLDHFMIDVYEYYRGCGIWCICLGRLLNYLTVIFVATFTTFLTQCINYSKFRHSTSLSEVIINQCTKRMSAFPNLAIWLLALFLTYKVFLDLLDIRRLIKLRDFFLYLLDVPDSDMQTISWQEIVARLMALRDSNPLTADKISPRLQHYMGNQSQSKQRMDAHDIANRLMRKDNYLIALFNKEILDLTLPFPFLRGRQIFSRTIEWNLNYCILGFFFTRDGQVNQLVLKDSKRRQLSNALRDRFVFAGFMNVLCAPVLVIYLLIIYFFKYFNEYQKNPSALGSRQYTPLAEWKFREFNELPHLFTDRINMSYPFASRYVDQFPKIKMTQIARFIAFLTSAVVSVLALASVIDPELFLGFEITKDRTVLFYLGVMGTLWAIAHGAIPPDNLVFDPEYALRNVIEYTHYMPDSWQDQLHSDEVKKEFSALYKMKIVIFMEEVLSIIVTPFVLWFSLPQCSDRIIDFFREFTVHVDGLGYVCSFAVFDFKKGVGTMAPRALRGAGEGLRDDYYSTKHGKMAASYYGFLDNYAINPTTGIPGHIPPAMRHQFHMPPAFPALTSPTLAAELHTSRTGHVERPRNRAPIATGVFPTRTPRFIATGAHGSPVPSILLDPHHQPSSSGFGGRSMHGLASRSRYQASRNIIEYPNEEDEDAVGSPQRGGDAMNNGNGDISGLDESVWETSPNRTSYKAVVEEEEEEEELRTGTDATGVLGLLYQFQKAQTDGRGPGVHI